MDSQSYNKAAKHFSAVLSLNPVDRMDIFIKRSKARVSMDSWEDALSDADEVSFILTLDQTVFIRRVCRLSSSTRHLIVATNRGMQYYMVQDAIPRLLKHSIQCSQNWMSLPTNIIVVSQFLKITQIIMC